VLSLQQAAAVPVLGGQCYPPGAATSHRSSTTVTSQQSQSPVNSFDHRSSATVSVVSHSHQSSATVTVHQLQSPVIASSRPSTYFSSQPSSHGPSSNYSSETYSAIQSVMAAVYSPVPVHGEQAATFPQPVPCRSFTYSYYLLL
jgi:hypothetical protein